MCIHHILEKRDDMLCQLIDLVKFLNECSQENNITSFITNFQADFDGLKSNIVLLLIGIGKKNVFVLPCQLLLIDDSMIYRQFIMTKSVNAMLLKNIELLQIIDSSKAKSIRRKLARQCSFSTPKDVNLHTLVNNIHIHA